jgi:isochorismate hydrolase
MGRKCSLKRHKACKRKLLLINTLQTFFARVQKNTCFWLKNVVSLQLERRKKCEAATL